MADDLRFPDGFLWGAATSAHQVEGGNTRNDWWRFEQQPGAIADGHGSGAACRHFERFDEDFALASGDGHNAHRLSFEWSRLETAPGRFDPDAVAHYHAVLASLRRHALTPIVTLHHFTNPLWLADEGGWASRRTIESIRDVRPLLRARVRRRGGLVVHRERTRGDGVPRLERGRLAARRARIAAARSRSSRTCSRRTVVRITCCMPRIARTPMAMASPRASGSPSIA
jgi:hypothetical protein